MQWFLDSIKELSSWTGWLGLLASALVLVSFLMKNEKQIRLVNILGCVVFVVYGFFISSFSVWFMNGALVAVHVVKLVGSFRKEKQQQQTAEEQATAPSEDTSLAN